MAAILFFNFQPLFKKLELGICHIQIQQPQDKLKQLSIQLYSKMPLQLLKITYLNIDLVYYKLFTYQIIINLCGKKT